MLIVIYKDMNDYDPNYVYTPVYFLLGVKIIIVNEENKILILKRSAKTVRSGGWDLPGGGIDENENPREAAIREIKEETNLDIARIQMLEAYLAPPSNNKNNVMILGYVAHASTSEIKLSWEHEHFAWMTPEQVQRLELPKTHALILDKYIKDFGNK